MKKACFKLLKEESTQSDTTFERSLNDTSDDNSGFSKYDYLTFHIQISKKYGDTTALISLRFFDAPSYLFYKNELSKISKYHSSKNSVIYNFKDPDEKEEGFEYLINDPIIGGLTEEKLDETVAKRYTKKYRLYFYCIINSSGKLTDLSKLFK